MIHIKLDAFTVYIAQPGGGIDIRCGIMVGQTKAAVPKIIGFHFTQSQDYHNIRGNFLTLFFWGWARTLRIGKVYDRNGKQIRQ